MYFFFKHKKIQHNATADAKIKPHVNRNYFRYDRQFSPP